MLRRLLPRKDVFFRDMEAAAAKAVEITAALRALFAAPEEVEAHVAAIGRIEHEADAIAHASISRLHQTFVTPLDRNEINRIFQRIDDVVDLVDNVAQRSYLYELRTVRVEAWRLLGILERQLAVVARALAALSDLRHPEDCAAT